MHGDIACASGVVDYLEDAYAHHFSDSTNKHDQLHQRVAAMMDLGHQHETEQANRVLDLLRDKQVRIIGADTVVFGERAPTIAFTTEKYRPLELAEKLSETKVGVGGDNFYAYRLMQALGIDPDEGVVRISLVHYTSKEDVDRLLNGLDDFL